MTDKQMIDKVDVKECEYYCNGKCERYEEFVEADYANYSVKCICEEENTLGTYDICDYQQLTCKQQECNKLYIQLKADEEYHKEEENNLRKIIKNKEERNIKLYEENKKLKQTLAEIKEIAEPYKMPIKKICGNCKKYDDCHACCYKDINCYKYTSSKTDACEEFTYLDEFVPNLLANNILQKISECETENE